MTSPRFPFGFRLVLSLVACAACARGVTDDVAVTESPTVADKNPPSPDASHAPDASARPGDASADVASDGPDLPDAPSESGPPDAGPPDAGPPPIVDGVIGAGEYGVHVDGQNQQTSSTAGNVWYMTASDTHLYVAVSAANVAEGLILYLDHAPLTPSTSGTSADGSLLGEAYDNTRVTLPFRADFVAYVKSTYQEHRTADGANGWSAPVTTGLTVQGTGTVREIAIPWTAIRAAGRPLAFSWLGYVTSPGGFVYGEMPIDNPGGSIGLDAPFGAFYKVNDTTPGTGTKPFAAKLTL